MKVSPFRRIGPESVAETVEALAVNPDAQVLAGGQSLVPMMALRLAAPPVLVDIGRAEELSFVDARRDGTVRVGATTTQTRLLESPELRAANPLVGAVVRHIAHEGIRNRGTVGGSLAHADRSAEWPALVLALDGAIEVTSSCGTRTAPAEEFFLGPFLTALEPAELLTAVILPPLPLSAGSAVVEVTQREGDFALAGAIATARMDSDRVTSTSVALMGVAGTPVRPTELERALVGGTAADVEPAVEDLMPRADGYAGDVHISAKFRAHLARVVARRALERAIDQARRKTT